jgi:hypothetical protein
MPTEPYFIPFTAFALGLVILWVLWYMSDEGPYDPKC